MEQPYGSNIKQNNFRDKIFIKTLPNRINKGEAPKTYIKRFFTNCILVDNSVKTAFYTTILEENKKEQWKA